LLWCVAAAAVHPSAAVALIYFGVYLALRFAMAWTIGIWGLKQHGFWKNIVLVPVWDALALVMWLTSFARSTIRWRGGDYYIRNGLLVPATAQPSTN